MSKDDDDEMDFPVDAGGASMSSAVKGASEDDIPKFARDRSLEAMFVDIPKVRSPAILRTRRGTPRVCVCVCVCVCVHACTHVCVPNECLCKRELACL